MCKIIVKWSRHSKKKIGDVGTLGNIVEQYGSVKLIQAHEGMGGRIR